MTGMKLLAGALLAGIGIATGEVTLVATAAAVGVNWASEGLAGLWPGVAARQQSQPLVAAYAAAIRKGVAHLEAEYRRTVDPRSDLAAFRLVAGCAASVADAEFPAGVVSVNAAQDALAEALAPLLHGHDERQAAFLRERLLPVCAVAFQAQLVQDDAAWRAFHGALLQTMAANSARLQATMDRFIDVLASWSDPTAGMETLRAEIARQPLTGDVRFDNRGMQVQGDVYQAERQYFGSAHAEGSGTATVINTLGTPPSADPQPITILFLAANPTDTIRLRLDREMRAIQTRLQTSSSGARFQVEQVWAARREDVVNGLQRHRPDLVHFAGHASEDGRLLVEGTTGFAEALTPNELRVFLAAVPGIRCVVLNACWSDALAGELLQAVESIAGMPVEVNDTAAIQFAAWFYGSLANGLNVQAAFEVAKAQMLPALGPQGLTDATAPRLRTRPGVDAATIRLV